MRLTMERETGWAAWKGAGCRDFQRPPATKPELRPGQASSSASPSGTPAAASAQAWACAWCSSQGRWGWGHWPGQEARSRACARGGQEAEASCQGAPAQVRRHAVPCLSALGGGGVWCCTGCAVGSHCSMVPC